MTTGAHTARKTPSQARSRLTVDAILEAAARVFEQHGYAAGTTNRIAARAGISIGSLYQYFPNKDAILVALTERHIDEGAAVVAPLLARLDATTPLDEALRDLTNAMVALHRKRPALHRVLVEEAPRPPQLRARFDALFEAASQAVAEYLRKCPEVSVGDPCLAARMVVQIVESITHSLVIHPAAGATPDSLVDETVQLLCRYLTSQ
jgi:AcrR family transcriptional regulator